MSFLPKMQDVSTPQDVFFPTFTTSMFRLSKTVGKSGETRFLPQADVPFFDTALGLGRPFGHRKPVTGPSMFLRSPFHEPPSPVEAFEGHVGWMSFPLKLWGFDLPRQMALAPKATELMRTRLVEWVHVGDEERLRTSVLMKTSIGPLESYKLN